MVKLFVSPGVQFLMSFENYGCGIDNKTRKAQALKKDRPLHVHFLFSRWMANTHFRGTRPDIEMVYKKTVGRGYHATDTKGNFMFERSIPLDRSQSVLDLRPKR